MFDYLDAVNEYGVPLTDTKNLRGIKIPFDRKLLRIEQYLGTPQKESSLVDLHKAFKEE